MRLPLLLLLLLWPCAVWCLGDIPFSFIGEESSETLVHNFNQWIERNGGASWSKIEVALIPGYRLGAVAKQPIHEDELYLEVPWRMVISEETIGSSDVGAQFERLKSRHGLDVGEYLLLYMLHERFREGSFWKSYLDILPRRYTIPFYWSPAELSELQGTGIPEEVDDYIEQHKRLYRRMSAVVREEGLLSAVRGAWDWDLFMWGSSVLDSRTIWINGRIRCFLPMLDMVNNQDHSSRVHHTVLKTGKQITQTKAIWAVQQKGEQLFENYGSNNAHNLLYHGFVLEHNSHDSAKFSLGEAQPAAAQLLSAFRVPLMHKISPGQEPVSLMADARIRALGPEEIAQARQVRRNYGQRISARNEAAALSLVWRACVQRLPKQFKTVSEAVDTQLLAQEGLNSNVRLAATFRRQQRQIVQGFCDSVRTKQAHGEL